MKINKGVIKCLLNAQQEAASEAALLGSHDPIEHRLIVKLVYYEHSRWEEVEEGSLFLDSDVSKALSNGRLKRKHNSKDTILPFIIILNPGTYEDAKFGDIFQVDATQVVGTTNSKEFIALADKIQKDRYTKDGEALIEKIDTNIKESIQTLDRYWSKYRLQIPWIDMSVADINSFMYYELPSPHLKSKIDVKFLQTLLRNAESEEE